MMHSSTVHMLFSFFQTFCSMFMMTLQCAKMKALFDVTSAYWCVAYNKHATFFFKSSKRSCTFGIKLKLKHASQNPFINFHLH